ncbi:hypothetical protein ACFLRR_04085 [Bacteroidota bacterium]
MSAAENGTTILVKEGVYPELIFMYVKENITLIGQNATICPPDDLGPNGDGKKNINLYGCDNIKIMNFKFDGKFDNYSEYPVYCAIAFTHSNGEASHNQIKGYHVGIASYNLYGMMDLKLSNNKISDFNGQGINIIGDYKVEIDHNNISCSFDDFFSHWYGIKMQGGTGIITKNLIKLKNDAEYPEYSAGIYLLKLCENPAINDRIAGLENITISQNIINSTYTGVRVNTEEDWANGWSINGLKLLSNTFVKLDEGYLVYNYGVEYEVK